MWWPWKRQTETPTLNVSGLFRDWKLDHYTMSNGKHCLWICNGFNYFRDYQRFHAPPTQPLLQGLTSGERRAVWNELHLEIRRRALVSLETMVPVVEGEVQRG